MPQGRPELHAFWKHDGNALTHIEPHYNIEHGCITPKSADYQPTVMDLEAIEYLITEWDYCYDEPTL